MRSRFSHLRRWRLPRHKRSYRVWGAEEDRGRYLKCWNCGFLIDTTKTPVIVSESSGLRYSDAVNPDENLGAEFRQPITGTPTGYWDNPFQIGLAPLNGPDGTPNTVFTYTLRTVESVAGCPFCGTTNLP
jgi:hypothetical protein